MSTVGSFTADLRRVAQRALAAVLLVLLLWGAAAIAKTAPKSSVVRAGDSLSRPVFVDGNSWG